MATFHPYPTRLLDLKGERDVLGAVSTLSFESHVFVRLGILDPSTNKEREIDFLVLHPELGILLIEVKGGRLVHKAGQWYRDYQGSLEPLKESPGEQLTRQQHMLRTWLKERVEIVPGITRILALPHMDWPVDQDLDTDLPACRVIDRTRLKDLFVNLRRAVAGHSDWAAFRQEARAHHHRIGATLLGNLVRALEPAILPPPSLAELLREEGEVQDHAAQTLLSHLSSNFALGRFHVEGAPGSGKSLIARQTARIWAAEGRKVLFLAYNKALTHATQVALEDLSDKGQVLVSTYHDLLFNLLYDLKRLPDMSDLQQFFNSGLPAVFASSLDDISDRWDAIAIDEAQDLDPEWIPPLLGLLRHPKSDPVLLVEDPAQSIYRQGKHTFGQPWRIGLNLRQHPVLRQAAWQALPGCSWDPPTTVGDEEGILRFVRSAPDTWRRDLAGILDELAAEGLEPGQVMILAPHRPESLGLTDGQLIGPWNLNASKDWWEGPRAGQVRFGTVQGFKGLESDVVVYLAPHYRHDKADRFLYTALTRARHRAVILEKALPKPEREPAPSPSTKLPEPAPPPLATIRKLNQEQHQALVGALKAANKPPRKQNQEPSPLPTSHATKGCSG